MTTDPRQMTTDSITVIERRPLAYEENQRVYTLDELREMFGNVPGNVVVPLLDIILALRETVRVLGEECKEWRCGRLRLKSLRGPTGGGNPAYLPQGNVGFIERTNANPGARAAVENAQ